MANKPAPLTGIQQHALDWCRGRESFLHVEFRRAEITGPTIYSLIKRKLVEFDSTTSRYRAVGVGVDRYQSLAPTAPDGGKQP